ncbi:MAG: thioredoxin domain-containing protein [Deltaproteobacteria bacterium]|nr:thioredoxin domain-containing protein [Deltaproteobacteria bacterium]
MKRLFLVSFLALVAAGCEKATPPPPSVPATEAVAPVPAPAPQSAPSGVLATVNGEPITDAEVIERVKNQLRKIESEMYDIKKEGLDSMIEEKLVAVAAKKKGMSADELIKAEVEKKVEEPTEAEITAFYSIYKKRFKDAPLEKVKDKLITQIKATKRQGAYNKFTEELRKNAKLEILMERPRLAVSVDDDPSKGKAGAPVTLIEFSDFQCPFCKRARETVNKIVDTYGDKVHYVFRDFPLSFHKQAKKAAEAAECADDQKKYWEYNALLWENQGDHEPDKLKDYAKKLGLNEKKFSDCLESDKYAEEVEKDQREGEAVGVSGTPAYFINGIMISGAQPFERFQELIDEELALAGKK